MARGNNVSIPSGSGSLQKTLFSERQTILVLNPNNGILYVKMQAPADPVTWDFIVPSQSRAYLPGPWLEYGLWYVDQSGGGATGNVTVFESDQRFDMPDYAAIGVARLVQATSMDIVEGTVPANPGAGIIRLWADGGDHIHRLGSGGQDSFIYDQFVPLTGIFGGNLGAPSIVQGSIGKILLDQTVAVDVWNNTPLGAGYNAFALVPDTTIVVPDTGDLVFANVALAIAIVNPNAGALIAGSGVMVDGPIYPLSRTAIGTGVAVNGIISGGFLYLGALSAGNHTFGPRGWVAQAISGGAYLRCATAPTQEFLHMTVFTVRA